MSTSHFPDYHSVSAAEVVQLRMDLAERDKEIARLKLFIKALRMQRDEAWAALEEKQ